MSKRNFIFLTFVTALAFGILMALGSWQVQRLHWKENLLAQMNTKLSGVVQDLDALSKQESQDLAFTRVQAQGTFMANQNFFFPAKKHAGRLGLHVITPLRLNNGHLLFVNRGWIPEDQKDKVPFAEGSQQIQGVLRFSQKPGPFTPENNITANAWYWMDLSALYQQIGAPPSYNYYLVQQPYQQKLDLPVPVEVTTKDIPNKHLSYALTWYSLGFVLLVIYGIFVYKNTRKS